MDERYIYHRVRKGETLSTIAGEYGISVRDLKRANKGLLFPHEGDTLMIPRKKITEQTQERMRVPAANNMPT
ncbi:MAG: LysM peptidoglycan-binding domain-containing protein [Marinilabiliales bacterium]|nr:LysM peptidoglycan-binding domain-containing protein [Marinilabiliales bacterium]